ncbi:MAG: phosphotransferase [Candidatus Hodarchaeota archaeon]
MNIDSELLSTIPQTLLPKKINSTRVIKGGLNNKNILLNEKWLIKEYLPRDEANDPVYLRFLREKETLLLLKENLHVPQILKYYEDAPKFFLVRKWINGHPITTEQIQNNPTMLIRTLISIHKETKSTGGDFHYLDVIKRYLKEYEKIVTLISDGVLQSTEFSVLPQYYEVDQYFTDRLCQIQKFDSGKNLVRIHGDLVFSNIILTENQQNLILIDWEYSTLGNPLIDLAYLFSQNQVSLKLQGILTKEYENQLKVTINPTELKVYYKLMLLMSALWYAIQASRLKFLSVSSKKDQLNSIDFIKLSLGTFQELNLSDK